MSDPADVAATMTTEAASASSSSTAAITGPAVPPTAPTEPDQLDPSDPQRSVKYKKSNAAYLSHQRWKEQQKVAKRARKTKKDDDAAASDDDEEEDITEISLWKISKIIVLTLLSCLALGQFVTGDVLYGYRGKWRNPHRWWPRKMKTFSTAELSRFDGATEGEPVYISILGNVYDVSSGGRTYRPGGSYSFFSGKDASRAYVTGCFDKHLTHDLRGLSQAEVEQIRGWKRFFDNHPKYYKVGDVRLPHIDPESPLPEPC